MQIDRSCGSRERCRPRRYDPGGQGARGFRGRGRERATVSRIIVRCVRRVVVVVLRATPSSPAVEDVDFSGCRSAEAERRAVGARRGRLGCPDLKGRSTMAGDKSPHREEPKERETPGQGGGGENSPGGARPLSNGSAVRIRRPRRYDSARTTSCVMYDVGRIASLSALTMPCRRRDDADDVVQTIH